MRALPREWSPASLYHRLAQLPDFTPEQRAQYRRQRDIAMAATTLRRKVRRQR